MSVKCEGKIFSFNSLCVCMSHLIFVFDLYVQRQSKADLRQLGDQDTILRAVKSGRIVIFIDQQDGEGGHDGGRRGRAVLIQLCRLHRDGKTFLMLSQDSRVKRRLRGKSGELEIKRTF